MTIDKASIDRLCELSRLHMPVDYGHLRSAELDVEQFQRGQSNPTYLLHDKLSSRKCVLRMRPLGPLLDKSAHDMIRESSIIQALSELDKVPVPRILLVCSDKSIIGTEFYLMSYIEGRVIQDSLMPQLSGDISRKRQCWFELVRVLASLHKVQVAEIMSPSLVSGWLKNRPAESFRDFYPRQIRKLAMISKKQASVTGTPNIANLEQMLQWFGRNAVRDETVVMHGDYKLDNVIFDDKYQCILAVVDWELSTLGHPLADLANMLQPFYISGNFAGINGLQGRDDCGVTVDELLKYYCMLTGRRYTIDGWQFCLAFSFFKMSVILQGVAARSLMGQASSARAKEFGALTGPFAEFAWRIIEQSSTEAKL